jgi:hypothetical protein
VSAKITSDDTVMNEDFDATAWFESASDAAIARLQKEHWRRSPAADNVAYALEHQVPEIAEVLKYVRSQEECGFEVYIDEDEALQFIAMRRSERTAEAVSQGLAGAQENTTPVPTRPRMPSL